MESLRKIVQRPGGDKFFLFLPLALSILGLFLILDASSVFALKYFNDKFYFFKRQFFWFIGGICGFYLFSLLDYKILKKWSLPLFLVSLFLLVLVLFPGIGKEVYGGRRWLSLGIGNFGFQPSELLKISLIIYLSALLEKKRNFFSLLFTLGIILVLLLLEPDLGTAIIVLAIGFVLYFVSGAPVKEILLSGLILPVTILPLVLFSSYRRTRLISFLRSSFDASQASYHVKQVLIGLGSGGIFGKGIGQSRQKFLFLPEITTDSIFAVIGEEFGFLGSSLLLIVLFFLVYRLLNLAIANKDPFAKSILSGFAFLIGFQTIVNLGAMVVLIPMTGVPLPFISYGGSSLLICLSIMGIVYNISKQNKR